MPEATKAQVILEANSAVFMAQIRSIASQASSIFNRVFSALRLPGLLSIGGLIAASVAMPATGRTIGEAVQMQRLHAQLDRLNATFIAELAPLRMFVLKILIAILAAMNAAVRFLSNLTEQFPQLGDLAKSIASFAILGFALYKGIRIANVILAFLARAIAGTNVGPELGIFRGVVSLSAILTYILARLSQLLALILIPLFKLFKITSLGHFFDMVVKGITGSLEWVINWLKNPSTILKGILIGPFMLLADLIGLVTTGIVGLAVGIWKLIAALFEMTFATFGATGGIFVFALNLMLLAGVIALAVASIAALGYLLWRILGAIGTWIVEKLKQLGMLIRDIGLWLWDNIISIPFNMLKDWFDSLTAQPAFTIQGTSGFGGFTREELELASPKLPELVTIGTKAIDLLDQIKKLIEQQRSLAIKRVSGVI
jgi:hypothetical protein